MRRLLFFAVSFFWPAIIFSQRSIVVLGSSTAQGNNASAGHSWVALTSQYLEGLGLIDTIYNRAVGGYTTWNGLPDGSPRSPDSLYGPTPGHNVTFALSLTPLPKVVLVNFPTNDIKDGYSITQFLANLRTIYNSVTAGHVPCFITTSQPRDDQVPIQVTLQKQARDSILAEFPGHSLNFWDTVADPVTLAIRPEYRSPLDNIHLNDAGHLALFHIVQGANIMMIPLPLSITNFTAWLSSRSSVLIRWTTADGTAPVRIDIQRSADGRHFENIEEETENDGAGSHEHSWTDAHVLAGRSFYRLKISGQGDDHFSQIVTVSETVRGLALIKTYFPSGPNTLVAEVGLEKDQLLHLAVLSSEGRVLRRVSFAATAPVASIPVSLSNLAAGQYFLQVTGSGGKTDARAFAFRH